MPRRHGAEAQIQERQEVGKTNTASGSGRISTHSTKLWNADSIDGKNAARSVHSTVVGWLHGVIVFAMT